MKGSMDWLRGMIHSPGPLIIWSRSSQIGFGKVKSDGTDLDVDQASFYAKLCAMPPSNAIELLASRHWLRNASKVRPVTRTPMRLQVFGTRSRALHR